MGGCRATQLGKSHHLIGRGTGDQAAKRDDEISEDATEDESRRRLRPWRGSHVERSLAGEDALELIAGDRAELIRRKSSLDRTPEREDCVHGGQPVGGVAGEQDLPW